MEELFEKVREKLGLPRGRQLSKDGVLRLLPILLIASVLASALLTLLIQLAARAVIGGVS